jgi:YbbR domain-containing protein
MSLLRGLLFDNLGLKLTALLLALLVYLHVYTERPAHLVVQFPLQITDLDSTLSLSGPVPAAVTAELRGTGKQLIRLRLGEPVLKISLAGVSRGRFERALTAEDLPISSTEGVEVERILGSRMLQVQLDRKVRKRVPVAPRVQGAPAAGSVTWGAISTTPGFVTVTGPEAAVARLDSVVLGMVRIDARHDTVRAQVAPLSLPDWCTSDPPSVAVRIPIHRGAR